MGESKQRVCCGSEALRRTLQATVKKVTCDGDMESREGRQWPLTNLADERRKLELYQQDN